MTDLLEPIPLEEEKKPLTTWRVVIIAAIVALVIGCLPALTTALIVGDNLRSQQRAIIDSRVEGTKLTCQRINSVISQSRTQTQYLQSIILNSTKQSRAFEKTFRQLGLPSYSQRLAMAEKQAAGLGQRQIRQLNCRELVLNAKLKK